MKKTILIISFTLFALANASLSWAQIATDVNCIGCVNNTDIENTAVTSAKINDYTISNIDISGTAGILGTKIYTNFGTQNIVTTGKVGIGVSTPNAPLDVESSTHGLPVASGTAQTNNKLRLKSTVSTVIFDMGVNGIAPYGNWLQSTDSANLGLVYSLLLNPNGGNVGIGVTAPNAPLDVESATHGLPVASGTLQTNNKLRLKSTVSTVVLDMGVNGTAPYGNWLQSTDNVNLSLVYPLLLNPNGGNVGIGTAAPKKTLHVYTSNTYAYPIRVENTGTKSGIEFKASGTINPPAIYAEGEILKFETGNLGNRMVIDSTGQVGIGTWNPSQMLDVAGRIYLSGDALYQTAAQTFYLGNNAAGQDLSLVAGGGVVMMLKSSGNVGIGTMDPGIYKLAVNGSIHAKEVVVETNWADFVFDKDYDLKPLDEVEKHIKSNRHLPGIPSASEVAQNGVNIGEMQSKLLQKIEELTLYVIDLKGENDSLKNRVNALETVK